MTIKYYFSKLFWGLIAVAIFANSWLESDNSSRSLSFFILSIINALFCPFAMYSVKTMVLKFSTEKFWSKHIYTSGVGGFPAMAHVFCFIFAIPLSIVFLIQRITATSRNHTGKVKR